MQVLREYLRLRLLSEKRTQSKRLGSFSNFVTRKVMELINNGTTSGASPVDPDDFVDDPPETSGDEIYYFMGGNLPLKFDASAASGEEETDIGVVVEIERSGDPGEGFNVSGYSADPTGMHELGLHVIVNLPTGMSDSLKREVRSEIANTIRHELEHLTQGSTGGGTTLTYGRGDEYFRILHSPEEVDSPYAKYLLKPEEVSAHARGYIQDYKTRREFEGVINGFLTNYVKKDLITAPEKEIILKTYLDWADRHVHTKSWRKT